MRVPPPELLPILRSAVQGEILAATYLSPDREYSVTDLAQLAGTSLKAAGQEVGRLVAAGFLDDRRFGNQRLVRRPATSRMVNALGDLLAATYGPLPVLTEELGGVSGVEQAFIYGSWAARHEGQPGGIPDDIDVLVVGTASLDDLDEVAERCAARLHRAVNIRRVSGSYWSDPSPDDTFVTAVRASALVPILLDDRCRRRP